MIDSRIRRIVVAASLAPLLAVAMTAHAERPMRKAPSGNNPPIIVYPIDRGFAIHDPHKFGEVSMYVRYDVFYAEGNKSAEFMCNNRPNRAKVDVNRLRDWDSHKKFGDGKLTNGKIYTVMLDKHEEQWAGTGTHNRTCLYYITKVRPNAHGKPGLIVKNLDSGFVNARHSLGNGWIRLQWKRPKGEVTGYSIYHAEGTIRGGNTAHKMCGEEPNRVNVGANATNHTVTGLKTGTTYSFLVEAHYRSPPDGATCAIVYHVGATLRAAQAAPPRNINPQNKDVSHRSGDKVVRINWQRARGRFSGYSIYYAPGRVNVETLCGARPNAIDINDRNVGQRDIYGLKNGQPYTFLLKVKDASGNAGPCPYLYHFTATPNKPRITEMIHIHPGQARIEQRDWHRIWIDYPKARGAIDYYLYSKIGKHTDPKKFCAERPNARSIAGGRTDTELSGFNWDTEYTFMVEPQFADRPPMQLRTVCHSVLFGHQTAVQWAPR